MTRCSSPARKEDGALAGGELRSAAMPPFVRVVRHLRFGLTWEVDTEVLLAVRSRERGRSLGASCPWRGRQHPGRPCREREGPGESRPAGGADKLALQPRASRARVVLTAPADGAWVEEWTLEVGTMWHVVLGGIPPLYPTTPGVEHRPTWEPWPGESVELRFSRPVGAGGQTLTIDSTQLSLTPGLRATDAELSLVIRSSRGVQHQIALPAGAELLQATVSGQGQPLRTDSGRVTLPVPPGLSRVQLRWREARGLKPLFAPEALDVGASAVNASTVLHLPADRWVLLTGGPLVGPSVLFWSLLVVTVLVAVALGRVKLVPLGTLSWVLLGVGLTQVPVVAGAVVVACLLAFGWRAVWRLHRVGQSLQHVAGPARRTRRALARHPLRGCQTRASRRTGHAGPWQRLVVYRAAVVPGPDGWDAAQAVGALGAAAGVPFGDVGVGAVAGDGAAAGGCAGVRPLPPAAASGVGERRQ